MNVFSTTKIPKWLLFISITTNISIFYRQNKIRNLIYDKKYTSKKVFVIEFIHLPLNCFLEMNTNKELYGLSWKCLETI